MNIEYEMKRWAFTTTEIVNHNRQRCVDIDKAIEIAKKFAKECRLAETGEGGIFEAVENAIVDYQCARYRELNV